MPLEANKDGIFEPPVGVLPKETPMTSVMHAILPGTEPGDIADVPLPSGSEADCLVALFCLLPFWCLVFFVVFEVGRFRLFVCVVQPKKKSTSVGDSAHEIVDVLSSTLSWFGIDQ